MGRIKKSFSSCAAWDETTSIYSQNGIKKCNVYNTNINKKYTLGSDGIEVRIKCGAAAGLVEDGCIKNEQKI